MFDWAQYRKDLTERIGDLSTLSPDSVGGYMLASGAGRKTARLDEKTRQLISLAVAVTTRCDGCIAFHSKAAVDNGATTEEIAEALGVAIAMNTGAALVFSARALDAVKAASSDVGVAGHVVTFPERY
ncbi:MAG: carboxymuconolactone decarboxylase family protein [Proteobacteria bacterium]|nr:carboxymuconolactone decarboxylase family protein [Pseudomonadota bacterium]